MKAQSSTEDGGEASGRRQCISVRKDGTDYLSLVLASTFTDLHTCARLAGEKSAIGGVKGRSRLSFHSGASPSYTFVRFLVVESTVGSDAGAVIWLRVSKTAKNAGNPRHPLCKSSSEKMPALSGHVGFRGYVLPSDRICMT